MLSLPIGCERLTTSVTSVDGLTSPVPERDA